jgi:ABC-type enterobactin transport system permease subunit
MVFICAAVPQHSLTTGGVDLHFYDKYAKVYTLTYKNKKTMQLIEIIYIIGIATSISAALPQIRRLLISKASDEFSLTTWVMWLGTQNVSLVYTASIGDMLLVGANILWIGFYATMVYLIVRYRYFNKATPTEPAAADA